MGHLLKETYLQDCRQLLQAFENSQSTMLRFELETAFSEFSVEITEFRDIFAQMHSWLQSQSGKDGNLLFLLDKQITRLQLFLKEMEKYISDYQKKDSFSAEEIIFVFERQHVFKRICTRHLDDFARLGP